MLHIKKAELNDIDLIRELTFKIWPQTYQSIISKEQIEYMLEMMYSKTSLTKQMTEDGCTFIITYDDALPVAFASYNKKNNTNIWKLNKIYILPNQQGKGIGKFIIDFIVAEIKAQNGTALQLQVNKQNKAKTFYEKLGFYVKEEAVFDIGNNYVMDDFIMELPL